MKRTVINIIVMLSLLCFLCSGCDDEKDRNDQAAESSQPEEQVIVHYSDNNEDDTGPVDEEINDEIETPVPIPEEDETQPVDEVPDIETTGNNTTIPEVPDTEPDTDTAIDTETVEDEAIPEEPVVEDTSIEEQETDVLLQGTLAEDAKKRRTGEYLELVGNFWTAWVQEDHERMAALTTDNASTIIDRLNDSQSANEAALRSELSWHIETLPMFGSEYYIGENSFVVYNIGGLRAGETISLVTPVYNGKVDVSSIMIDRQLMEADRKDSTDAIFHVMEQGGGKLTWTYTGGCLVDISGKPSRVYGADVWFDNGYYRISCNGRLGEFDDVTVGENTTIRGYYLRISDGIAMFHRCWVAPETSMEPDTEPFVTKYPD